jgi:surface antigen
MAKQEIKLGAFWDVIFNAINANFTELYDAQGNAVTAEALTQQLAGYVTTAALSTTLDGYVTDVELENYITTTALTQQLANYATFAAVTQELAGYATTAALNEVAGNKVDKIAGKDLSTNDYTDAEKNKLAGLKAPTKHEFTANNWGTADSNGVYSMAITSNQHVANVFRADGSNFENAAVAISVNGGTITIKSEETFAGYVILV